MTRAVPRILVAQARATLQGVLTDACDVYRSTTTQGSTGATKRNPRTLITEDVPCRVEFRDQMPDDTMRVGDGVRVEDSYVTLPELPGIGFEGKGDLIREMRALSA